MYPNTISKPFLDLAPNFQTSCHYLQVSGDYQVPSPVCTLVKQRFLWEFVLAIQFCPNPNYCDHKIREAIKIYAIIFWSDAMDATWIFTIQKTCVSAVLQLNRRNTYKKIFKGSGPLTLSSIYMLRSAVFIKNDYSKFLFLENMN